MSRRVRWLFRRFVQDIAGFIKDNSIDPFPIRHGFRGYSARGLQSDGVVVADDLRGRWLHADECAFEQRSAVAGRDDPRGHLVAG